MIARPQILPMTPPTMAPAWFFFAGEDDEGCGVEVATAVVETP